ncbi:transglycosylase SLT domain-containing protein [Streptomyces sp. RFCAC02]|uniref:transglycosylase SLT domain-containing protein n=1 Tax=Streptomyces sp. RFCAC02 TaxID=2499143 RepID=UPI00101EA149|nr:transglycosylase SLT domain-containing protein [Streptomyces sp. RFCAC02]
MPAHIRARRLTRTRRTATAALTTAGVAALALIAVPASSDAEEPAVQAHNARAVGWDVKADDVPGQRAGSDGTPDSAQQQDAERADFFIRAEAAGELQLAEREAAREAADRHAAEEAERRAARQEREAEQEAEREAADQRAAEQAAEEERAAEQAAEAEDPQPASAPAGTAQAPAAAPAAEVYPDTLDGWIRESLAIMAQQGIPGTYDGLYRNIMRESSGDPNAINLWDINAINGTPSIGLLQVIQPTFDTYHVPGTPDDIYDPVANITAAANYAYHRYGSIDNVNGPY